MVRRILCTVTDEQFEFILKKKVEMGNPSWDKFVLALAQDYPNEYVPETIAPVIQEEPKEIIEEIEEEPTPQIKEGSIWDD